MHYHWAKLYLQSYVLRGLPDVGGVIPEHFLENASAAVAAAMAIINLLLEDPDAQVAIGGVPHHIHGMIAFACMFLLKVATRYSEQLFVDALRFQRLIGGLAQHFKTADIGKDHLIHRMAEGLEKMADTLGSASRNVLRPNGLPGAPGFLQPDQPLNSITGQRAVNGQGDVPDYGTLEPTNFDFGDLALGLGMPFFDFEGTTLNGNDGGAWNFN